MKIDSSSLKPPPMRSPAAPAPKPAEAAARGAEAVSLSNAANAIQSGEKPAVNAAKIQEIKEAIAQGRFKINPEAIADGLIESARDLINRQRQA